MPSDNSNFQFVCSSGGIDEYQLKSNGLRVLTMKDSSAPVATVMVTYHVGSRNEAIGFTGSTHLLEHLMFKGSKNFNKEKGTSVWSVLQNVGASINATTWNDRTNYYELLPREFVKTALELEADRMRNAFINESDRQTEMTVVRNEFERGENNPKHALEKAVWATAYSAHPYHHSTIGWRSDIEKVPIDRLKEFYSTFYWPNNATLTVIGDFDIDQLLNDVFQSFGSIQKSPHSIPEAYTEEPDQEGPRKVTVRRAGELGVLQIAYKSPKALHPDYCPLDILSLVLTRGKSSRLYRSIVDKGLASSVTCDASFFKDEGLFIITATLTPETKHKEVKQIILDELKKIMDEGVTEDEVNRAKAQNNTQLAFSRDGTFSVASYLNEAIAVGDWKMYVELPRLLNEVKPSSIQQVAKKYIVEDRQTIGYFFPKGDGEKAQEYNTKDQVNLESAENASTSSLESPGGAKLAERVKVTEILPGVELYAMKVPVKDVVTIQGSILAGEMFSPKENPLVGSFTAKMLDQGTKKHTKFEISEKLASVGATITFYAGIYHTRFSCKCLSKDLPLVFDILVEQLREPSFSEEDFNSLVKREVARFQELKQNTDHQAETSLVQNIYQRGHPNYMYSSDETIQFAKSLNAKMLADFHAANYGTGATKIVVVGDIQEEVVAQLLKEKFSTLPKSPNNSIPPLPSKGSMETKKGELIKITINDKPSSHLYIGNAIGIDKEHEDYIPLFLANYILGGNFSARLMQTVRDKEGLTYHIRSFLSGTEFGIDGFWGVTGSFAPHMLDRGEETSLQD
eukprot:TRINITY_DN2059_c0_g1_i2.p1 TRINITY_DN2059_c0_g1~~TRINITY_DN2059_c0_g1_i2.p1  ORF type:complete len:806 (-),score=322.13 TRINITY_DN2059_c0_g1_i2:513-2903(-)